MKESKEHCAFCKILAGELPVSMIYEDADIAVFPPLGPVNKGHLLIIPKIHAPYMKDVEPKVLSKIMLAAQKLNAAIHSSKYKSEGVNLFLADGEAAQQEVFHFHLHLYPRYRGDEFGFKYNKERHFIKLERTELDKIADELKRHLKW